MPHLPLAEIQFTANIVVCLCQFLLTRGTEFTRQALVYTYRGRLRLRMTLGEAAVCFSTLCNAHTAQSLKVI